MVTMSTNGTITRRMVHHLVLEAFVGQAPSGHECDHIDFDPKNNRVENLRWVTHTENIRHTACAGRGYRGQLNGRSKLSESDVIAMRIIFESVPDFDYIAELYELNRSTVWRIVTRRAWKHVE
jgi:hypothetical protein